MTDFGGIILFRLGDGRNLRTRGSVKFRPRQLSYEKVANTDGSIDRTATVEGYEFELSLRHERTFDYDALMAADDVTMTFIHATEKVQRTFSKAKLIGSPDIDAMSGEVTGVTGVSQGYLETAI